MADKLKKIPEKLKIFWKTYSVKQKTIALSVVGVVFLTMILLSYFLTRTQYEKFMTCESTTEASEVVDLLKDQGIKYKLSADGKVIQIDRKRKAEANLLMGSNNIPNTGVQEKDLWNTSMSTTNEERRLKSKLYLENQLRTDLLNIEGIREAIVRIDQPKQDYTILSEEKETSVSVLLTTTDAFENSSVHAIANVLAGAVGNETTDQIRIMNQKGELLFGGNNDLSSAGSINSALEYKTKLTNQIVNNLTSILLKMDYDDVEVGSSNLKFNMDKINELYREYTPAEGQDQGLWKNSYEYTAKGANGANGGVPGTGSNDEATSYQIDTGDTDGSSVEIQKYEYSPNVKETNTEKEIGAMVPGESSISVVLTKYKIVREDDLKRRGLLKNKTFDEYAAENNQKTLLENVGQEVYDTVANATGISSSKISITAYEEPVFQATLQNKKALSNYLIIILTALIIGLLVFVVWKGTASVEVEEIEPELSVEELLTATKENSQVPDIEFEEKSEIRKVIDKFIDENPGAVAQLLRNWINEWG